MRGKELRSLRLRIGWTQEEMAKRLGVKRNTIIRYEKDHRAIPPSVAGYAICLAKHKGSR